MPTDYKARLDEIEKYWPLLEKGLEADNYGADSVMDIARELLEENERLKKENTKAKDTLSSIYTNGYLGGSDEDRIADLLGLDD